MRGIVRESGVDLLLLFSHSVVSDSFGTPWTAAHPAPLSMGFSRQQYGSGLPFPSPGNLPVPGTEPMTHDSCTADRFFTTEEVGRLGKTTATFKTDNQHVLPHIALGALLCVLCASMYGRAVWGRTDTCTCVAESLHGSHETVTTLLIGYSPIGNKKFKT